MPPFVHNGSFDQSAVLDVITNQAIFNRLALTAGGTLPLGAIPGAADIIYLNNTTATPGTQTTRTAVQMIADLRQALGCV